MADFGMEPIHIIDRDIWALNVPRSGPPDPDMVSRYTRSLKADGAPIVLDFEDFAVDQSAELTADSVFRLRRILKAFRVAAPRRPIGYYAYLPLRDYWRRIKGRDSPEFRAWQSQNDRVKPLERDVSMLFPSLYTLYEDRDGWRRFAIDNICEARRISHKPVYIFLWPGYENPAFMGRPVEGTYWAMELEVAHQYADGIVLWGGANVETNSGRYPWNPVAGWWTETRKFLDKIGLNSIERRR